MALKHRLPIKTIIIFIVSSVFIALLLLAEYGYLNGIFKKIGVYPVQESYTALFFVDAEKLSADYDDKNPSDYFTFGVYNHEGVDQNYPFWIDVYTSTEAIPVLRDSLFVKSGETVYRQILYEDVQKFSDYGIVTITLPFQDKSIDFKI